VVTLRLAVVKLRLAADRAAVVAEATLLPVAEADVGTLVLVLLVAVLAPAEARSMPIVKFTFRTPSRRKFL
jgi:hypothetical protein